MAITWQESSVYTSHTWKKVIDCGNNVLILINKGALAAKSTDGGKTFVSWALPIAYVYDMAYGGGMVFCVGRKSDNTGACAVSTDNGVSWIVTSLSWTPNVCCWADDRFILAGELSIYAAWTNNGTTINNTNIPEGVAFDLIAYGNGVAVIPVRSSNKFFITQDKGATWTSITVPKTSNWSDIKYDNGKFIVVTIGISSDYFLYSTNGTSWTVQNYPFSARMNTVIYDGAYWIFSPNVVGSTSPAGVYYKTSDLVNFTEGSYPFAATRGYFSKMLNGRIYIPTDMSTRLLYYIPNNPPTAPTTITIPTAINGGTNVTITWGAGTDVDGNLAGYVLERSVAGGAWTQVYRGALRTFTDSITFGWTTVAYRVKAYDSENAESGYKTSSTVTIVNNTAPTISGSNGDLGSFTTTPISHSYSVSDAQSDTVTVVEKVDGVTKKTYMATLGASNVFTYTADEWQQVLNGLHTLTVIATDSKGASATRTWTFTKTVNTFTLTITPVTTDAMSDRCVVNAVGNFPTGSVLTIKVCNNGNDTTPTWEDVSTKLGEKHFFTNATKTAENWAFGLQVTLERGTATGAVWLDYVNANFR